VQQFPTDFSDSLNIAVIGSGVAGMSAAWLLNGKHRVTVYEKESRLGGHSHTVDAPTKDGTIPVDTGFIVYNERNYPNLTAMFDHLGVPVKDSDMSFAASLRGGAFEYSGSDINGLFGQRSNALRPKFWRMLADLVRFYREAPSFLRDPDAETISMGDYFARAGYGQTFVDQHLMPMGAAIWSTTGPEMKAYPAAAFIRFFESHGLLRIKNRPQWKTVEGGSREYVKRLMADLDGQVIYGGAQRVRRVGDKVVVEDKNGTATIYDHVVFATHADEALALLEDADGWERELLGAFRYTRNRTVLHRDPTLMPKRKRVWSSWNFIGRKDEESDHSLCVSYWMNLLQDLPTSENLFVTLNPVHEPAEGSVIREFDYAHPFFDTAAFSAQRQLWSLQGRKRAWFCGSYFGYGFHEDALQSGLAVAEQLGGVRRPWDVEGESNRITLYPQYLAAAE